MTDQEETLLDSGKSLSKSRLWELQYAIYNHYGPEAWTRAGVPFYMTSNPYTARQYAQMAEGYLRDYLRGVGGMTLDLSQPVYIFDLGAGTGRFGFLFIREMWKTLGRPMFDGVKIRYIMTDMIDSNLHYLRHHPYLQEMIKRGDVDFVHYHTSFVEEPLKLLVSGKTLTPEKIVNPVIIIGNYFFDVIPQDVFKVVDKKLHEGQLSIYAKGKVDPANLLPEELKELRAAYTYVPMEGSGPYYEDRVQESILRYYAAAYEGIPFTMPVAAFQTLRYFNRLSQGRLLVLAGDQGVSNEKQVKAAVEPVISVQGGISLSVSYNAIAHYIKAQGGAAWLTTYPDPLFVVIAAAYGGGREAHPETDESFDRSFEAFQPSDYWKLTCCSEEEWKHPSIAYIMALVKLGNWDPLSFHAFFPAIRAQLPKASDEVKELLVETIKNVWQQFYPVSKEEGAFVMNLGVLLYELKLPADALLFFERSLALGGDDPLIYQNMAACYMALKQPDEALSALLKAKSLKS